MTTDTAATVLRTTRLHRQRAKKSRTAVRRRILCTGIAAALVCAAAPAFAASATWSLAPVSNAWNDASNWTPGGPPNGAADTATFGLSNQTFITTSTVTEVNGITFNPLASPFTIQPEAAFLLTISGTGITNSSLIPQNFVTWNIATIFARIHFTNSATAGSMVIFTNNAANIPMFNSGGSTSFFNNSNAGSGTFLNLGSSFAGGGGGFTQFSDLSSAGSGNITNHGGTASGAFGGNTFFHGSATAENGTFTSNGGTASGALGGVTAFFDSSTAGSATLTANGSSVSGASGGSIQFWNFADAGSATLTAHGGTNGGAGGSIQFRGDSTGGTATVQVNGASVNNGSINNGAGNFGGTLKFLDSANAGNGIFTTNGGSNANTQGGRTDFYGSSSAGSGTFTTNGGTVTGPFNPEAPFGTAHGGTTSFHDTTTAGSGNFYKKEGALSCSWGTLVTSGPQAHKCFVANLPSNAIVRSEGVFVPATTNQCVTTDDEGNAVTVPPLTLHTTGTTTTKVCRLYSLSPGVKPEVVSGKLYVAATHHCPAGSNWDGKGCFVKASPAGLPGFMSGGGWHTPAKTCP